MHKINNLNFHLKILEKERLNQNKEKKINNKNYNSNKIETRNQQINKIKRNFFEKINKINKYLAGLTTESRDRTQIIYIKNKSGSSLQIPWKLK